MYSKFRNITTFHCVAPTYIGFYRFLYPKNRRKQETWKLGYFPGSFKVSTFLETRKPPKTGGNRKLIVQIVDARTTSTKKHGPYLGTMSTMSPTEHLRIPVVWSDKLGDGGEIKIFELQRWASATIRSSSSFLLIWPLYSSLYVRIWDYIRVRHLGNLTDD